MAIVAYEWDANNNRFYHELNYRSPKTKRNKELVRKNIWGISLLI